MSHPIKDTSSGKHGSAGTKEAGAVRLLQVMSVHIANPHILLGTTSEGPISALGPDRGSCYGAHSLLDLGCCTHSIISARSGPPKGLDRIQLACVDVVFALGY